MADDLSPEHNDEYDIYGKTPPRTKILRKHRERRQRDKAGMSTKTNKMKSPISRRNTISYLYDDMISKADNTDSDQGEEVTLRRTNKRQMKLLRGSERDLKLDIASAQAIQNTNGNDLNGRDLLLSPQPSYQIGCNKRFMCLSGRTIGSPKSNRHSYDSKIADNKVRELIDDEEEECDEAFTNRIEFHQTLCLLVRMGCTDKQHPERNTKRALSREEYLWHEYKDVIWLELRAFHANRTAVEEDEYLYGARQKVETLLSDIMNYHYKYQRKLKPKIDKNMQDDCIECSGCISINCVPCLEAQTEALHEIEELTNRLEKAEALFPSGKAFAELFPLYRKSEFEARVKTISLWVNMVRLHRIKLMLLGRFLFFLDTKHCTWTISADKHITEVNSSPSDSNNSSSSNEYASDTKCCLDYYSNNFVVHLMNLTENGGQSPYRRYIENVLKTKAVKKSLNFLDKLHTQVLNKAQFTLEKPGNEDIFKVDCVDTEEDELKRYGAWSPEARAINLPSYRASFLFLAAVPLEVLHQFMLLRLEQRPPNPSPLSIRQLMRELKEGLSLAITQRIRTENYINAAVKSTDISIEEYISKLKTFDDCVKKVFLDYLDYLEKWALFEHETFQKSLLEDEWNYSCNIVQYILNGQETLEIKFCQILSSILKTIGERLMKNTEHLVDSILHEEDMKYSILGICRELQTLLNEEREMSIKALSFCRTIFKPDFPREGTWRLKEAILAFKCIIPGAIEKIQSMFSKVDEGIEDEIERLTLNARVREILMQGYKFGFEFYKDLADFIPHDRRDKLVTSLVQFANLWMKFVVDKCDRGRGMRPRWAYQGLEFLVTVCEPRNTKYLSDAEFEELKKNMDHCISHVIGTTAPSTPESGFYSASPRSSNSARSRGSSPSPRPTYKSQRSAGRKISNEKMSSPGSVDNLDTFHFESNRKPNTPPVSESHVKIKLPPLTHAEKVTEAVDLLENGIDERLRKQGLIGKLINLNSSNSRIRQRYVNFTWQRGIKIGQGRFGKVYTAVNNSTGEMMAVKEIPLQHNDNVTLRRVSEEMKILEGIVHKNLVKYYGIEVHREEMLLFMEYCQEGTLESLVAMTEGGLPELLVRRYTFQLVLGVQCLHDHGVVHRDIKTANIFLTEEGNCLKIGDFGCAAKIKFNTTMPGELKGFVGTQAYMAPEVFTRNMNEGHGRAADIWSVGCVVVEMSSGQRPWWQYDSNYQIMFKVGMGQSPDPPDNLIDEGLDFLELCFKFDPRERATAHELLDHDFVKVGDDL